MDMFSMVARVAARGGVAVALGGIDTGKSTFCRLTAEAAVRLGKRVAYLDTDIGQTTVGPPATIGLKEIASPADLEPEALSRPDAMYFVGATTPRGHLLPIVVGALKLCRQALASGADLVVVDTTGWIGGTQGQVLKLYKVEALEPAWVIGFQRGGELEPILGLIRRTLPAEVESVHVDPSIGSTTIDERADRRRAALQRSFVGPVHRWKVKPSILVPAVPPELDLASLDRLLVGLDDGKGRCLGLGILEHQDDGLRMVSLVEEGAKALRLGSLRVGPDFSTTAVDLRDLFLSD